MNLEKELESLCVRLYDIGALKFGDFKMKSGLQSPIYFDLRVMISFPALMEELSVLVERAMQSSRLSPDVICGVPYTALPVATLVSIKTGIPMLLRRKEPKKYGTMKLIEGKYEEGNECLIIEDVVTSGSSVLETARDLRKDGLMVKDVVIIVDREQGGKVSLSKESIKVHSLLTLTKIMEILLGCGKLNQETVDSVKKYIFENQTTLNGDIAEKNKKTSRLTATLKERAQLTENPVTKRLIEIMETKQTNLCLACDVTKSDDLLRIASELGEYICLFKTHYDIVEDWNERVEKRLREIAKKMNFLVFEDRKFSDIGNVVKQQCARVFRWADIVTLHSTAGVSGIEGAQQAAESVASSDPRGAFLVAQLSSTGSLTDETYCQATVNMSRDKTQFLVGLVAQDSSTVLDPCLLQLTPGVGLEPGSDALGQNYVSPESAVIDKGGDVIVVGRAILNSSDPQTTAKDLSFRLWKAFTKRVNQA